ncbi:MAG: M67 family metallopeptidase [Lachnospiraceae bacterium]|nr:M67 family metallopeptidase [Lachnospiraceae bacterium]
MISLTRQDYKKILEHAKTGLPNEACGLLGGTIEGENQTVTDIYLLRNVDESNEHFSMDPVEQLAAVKDIRAKGRQLLGNFHSHPESPSRPSQEDIRLAFDPKMHYMILSLQDAENPVLNSFHIEKGEVIKEELVIGEE